MKTLTLIVVSLFLAGFARGFEPLPAWHRVEGKNIGFFRDKGFEFSVDDGMAHHYEKPTVEISILIPNRFTDASVTNEFDSVILLSKDISTGLSTHSHSGKQRIILTIAETMIRKSQVVFYFRNEAKDVTRGSMYLLDLAKVLDDWKKSKEKKPNKGAATTPPALRVQSRPIPDSAVGFAWVTVKSNAATRDARILDAVVSDALTNRELASTMEFYGGASNRTVRYTGFPAGYKPTVSGYDFVALPHEPATGRKLTISLSSLWIDHAPPKDNFAFFLPEAPKRGALLGIYNSGDGTVGGCAVGYEIQEIPGGWRVRCAGYFDP